MTVLPLASMVWSTLPRSPFPISCITPSATRIESESRRGFSNIPVARVPMFLISVAGIYSRPLYGEDSNEPTIEACEFQAWRSAARRAGVWLKGSFALSSPPKNVSRLVTCRAKTILSVPIGVFMLRLGRGRLA